MTNIASTFAIIGLWLWADGILIPQQRQGFSFCATLTNSDMTNNNYEILFKILVLVVGAITTIYQLRNFRITFRSSIKTDLEILKMLDEADPNYLIVKKSITESIKKIYTDSNKKRFKIYKPGDFLGGLITVVGFGFWSYYLSRNGFSYWSLLTGTFAMSGMVGVADGMNPKPDNLKNEKHISPKE